MASFALLYVVFEDEGGPILKKTLSHQVAIPQTILQGIVTALFFLASGVGELGPLPVFETAIIPVNVTGAKGTVLIYSYYVDDPKARGGMRMESLMIFTPLKDQNKLLGQSLVIIDILERTSRQVTPAADSFPLWNEKLLEEAFTDIQKIFLISIEPEIQGKLSRELKETEIAVVFNSGVIQAIHNFTASPDLVSIIDQTHSKLHDTLVEVFESEFSPSIEVFGRTSNYSFLFAARANSAIVAASSSKGRLTELMNSIWDIILENSPSSISLVREFILIDDSGKVPSYISDCSAFLASFSPTLGEHSIFRLDSSAREFVEGYSVNCLQSTDKSNARKHSQMIGLFGSLLKWTRLILGEDLEHAIVKGPISNTLILPWDFDTNKEKFLVFVADSKEEVGMLNLLVHRMLKVKRPESLTT